jgi:hypothetical protein
MANQYPGGRAHHDLVNTSQVGNTRKQPNWLHSIIAGAAMLTISSMGVVLIFDWYFFSVVDGLSSSLRPIAGALRHSTGDSTKNTRDTPNGRERPERQGAKADITHNRPFDSSTAAKVITDKSNQPRDGDQAQSLFVPVRSAVANSKTPAN